MTTWRSAVVTHDSTTEAAINVLDRTGLRIVLVVDGDGRLRGTITDGDVRRALLRRTPLSAPVSDIMNSHPRTAAASMPKVQIIDLMKANGILQVPVVDDEGRILRLEMLQDLISPQRVDNPVFLMAGGFGSRLRPLTDSCPKPLLRVGFKPILEIILENFVSNGFHNFYISTHYLPEMIRNHFGDGERWNVSIQYIHEEEPLGTGGALGLLPKHEIDMPLIMMNGDLLTNLNFNNLLEFHSTHDGIGTMCVREYSYQIPYGVVKAEGNQILEMVEKPFYHFFVNAGIYVVSPELIHRVPAGKKIDMPTLLEQEMERYKINSFPIHEYWLDIGRMEDFQKAQEDIVNGIFG